MLRLILAFPTMMLAILMVPYLYLKSSPPTPVIDLDEWWGPEHLKGNGSDDIVPFQIQFNSSMIAYLRNRLDNVRHITPSLEGVGFQYGFNSQELPNWLHYWSKNYSFSDRAVFLNQYPQYKTNIQGLDIHFIRVKPQVPAGVEVVPILMLHGWPGSVREYYEAIPYLTAVNNSRNYALDVTIPSLPGFGFSSPAARPGCGADKMAVVFRNLMQRLGFEKYYVQGDDFGSLITKDLVTFFPKEVLGYHTKLPFLITPLLTFYTLLDFIYPAYAYNSNQQNGSAVMPRIFTGIMERTGYLHEQATKPDTIGAALVNSPAGLAAYILEKFATGTRNGNRNRTDGGLGDIWTKDQLLDNVMFYMPGAMPTAMRLYAETFCVRYFVCHYDQIPTSVPTISLQTNSELLPIPTWAMKNKFPNLISHTLLQDVGHFLAFEKPELFAHNIIDAVGSFRTWHLDNPAA